MGSQSVVGVAEQVDFDGEGVAVADGGAESMARCPSRRRSERVLHRSRSRRRRRRPSRGRSARRSSRSRTRSASTTARRRQPSASWPRDVGGDGGGEAVLGGVVDDCADPPDPAAGGLELNEVHLPDPVSLAWWDSEHPLPQPRPRSAVCPEPGRQQQSAPAEGPLNGGGGHLVAVGTHHRGDLAVPPGGPIRCVLRGDCLDRVHSRRRPWPLPPMSLWGRPRP